jgi:hypothetical protein
MGHPAAHVILGFAACATLWPAQAGALDSGDVRSHAEQSFSRLPPATAQAPAPHSQTTAYPPDQYIIGIGQGDMAKGSNVCRRVSELSARTEIAKQIRILVKEHMVDRVREHSGRDSEQDIELIREEIVQEYLQGVAIVDRQIDDASHTCSATAVMSRKYLQAPPSHSESSQSITR